MTPDEQWDVYMKALEEVQKHIKPSPETIKFMEKVDKQISTLSDKMEKMNLNLETHIISQKLLLENNQKEHEEFLARLEKIGEWQTEKDNKYGSMWEQQIQERGFFKGKFLDILWKVLLAGMLLLAGLPNLDKIVNLFN